MAGMLLRECLHPTEYVEVLLENITESRRYPKVAILACHSTLEETNTNGAIFTDLDAKYTHNGIFKPDLRKR